MSASIKFDRTEILDTTHIPRFIKHESATERFLNTLELARENGSILISDRRGKKIISLQGILTSTTEALLETAIDTFKELFARQEKNLDISWEGTGTRRYVATCLAHNFDRDHFHQLFVPWTAEFVVLSGIGEATAEDTIVNADTFITTTKAKAITLAGSAEPKIRFTITVNSPNNYVRGIELKNTDTGERMIVNYTGSLNSCVVEIDTRLKTVKVDGGVYSYYGVFPHFVIGANNILITVGDITDQQFVPTLSTNEYAIYGSTKIAQSFRVPYTDDTYRSIYLMMSYIGSIANYASIRIETDNNGVPSGTLVDANATGLIDTSDMTGGATPTWYKRDFTDRFRLYANTTYWIVITNAGSGGDSSNYYKWNYDHGSRAVYKLGNASVYSGYWTEKTDEDMAFKMLYGGINDIAWTQTYSVYQTKRYL